MLRDGEDLGALRLTVRASHTRQTVGDVANLDVEWRGVDKVELAVLTASAARRGVAGSRSRLELMRQRAAGLVTAAIDEMIVDHAGRLHEGVNDRWPDNIAAPRAQVFGDRETSVSAGTPLKLCRALSIGRPRRQSPISSARSHLYPRSRARCGPAPPSSAPLRMTPASRISVSFLVAPTDDLLGVEAVERFAESRALAQVVIQESPAWKPSSTSFSNIARSSNSGTPHSLS